MIFPEKNVCSHNLFTKNPLIFNFPWKTVISGGLEGAKYRNFVLLTCKIGINIFTGIKSRIFKIIMKKCTGSSPEKTILIRRGVLFNGISFSHYSQHIG